MSSGYLPQLPRNFPLRDATASLIVFLIALPLSMGIAVACGVPPALGLITGIVGGIVVGVFAGSPLQVSGPAAGLTVIVYELVQAHGLPVLGVVVLLAGLLQCAAGFLRLGKWFRAVSPAVIHGMLAGIGVLICVSQFHVMFDLKPASSGLPNLFAMPKTVFTAFHGGQHMLAGAVALVTLAVLFLWPKLKLDKTTRLPSPLVAIVVASAVAWFGAFPIAYINLPDSLASVVALPTADAMGSLFEGPVLISALTLALVASAETLLSAAAVDQMQHEVRAKFDKELVAQGLGNAVCGLLGALPLTGVIVRSSVNVESGAKTRISTILHGVWLLLAVLLFPSLLRLVPVSALGALLVFTGLKLAAPSIVPELRKYGRSEVLIYVVTIAVIFATNLLDGVLVGLVLSLIKLVVKLAQLETEWVSGADGEKTLVLRGTATFLALPALSAALDEVPDGSKVTVDSRHLVYIDHACISLLTQWNLRQSATGGGLTADWDSLMRRYRAPACTTP